MEKIKLSIIVPVYNVEVYLEQCLDSLVNQSLKDIEIIVVNDGSTDNSESIINEYKNKYKIISVINQINSGLSEARNSGIKEAKGKYLAFVDSDDYIETDMFENLYNKAEKYNCNMVICDMLLYWNENKIKPYNNLKQDENKIYELNELYKLVLDGKLNCQVMNKIYKRDIWINNNITFEKGKYYEDIYPSFKIINIYKKAMFINSPMYKYRMREGSITANSSEKKILDFVTAVKKARNYAEEHSGLKGEYAYRYFMSFDVNYGLYAYYLSKGIEDKNKIIRIIKEKIKLNYSLFEVLYNKNITLKSKIKFLMFKFDRII